MDIFSLEEDGNDLFVTQDSYTENVRNLADLVDDELDLPCSQVLSTQENCMQYSDISEVEDMEEGGDGVDSSANFE